MVTQSINLDGSTSVSVFGRTFNWFNQNLQMFNVFAATGDPTNTLNLTFGGPEWAIDSMTFSSTTSLNLNVNEANDGVGRYVESMRVINGNATINLSATYVQNLRIGDPGQNSTLNLTLGSGGAGVVRAYDGNDVVTLGAGDIHLLSLGDGNNVVTVNGGQINTLYASGNDSIALLGDARILQLKMDEGVNRLTTQDGNIESIYAYHAQNTILLGLGGAQQIVLSGSAAAQVIRSVGWLGSLQVYAGDQTNVQATTVVVGEGGAGYIQTSKGNDRITTGTGSVDSINTYDGNDTVTIGPGEVRSLQTGIGNDILQLTNGRADWIDVGSGNDTVTLGFDCARFVVLGDGNDVVSLTKTHSDYGVVVQGDSGVDTMDVSRFAAGVTISLNLSGMWQDFGQVGSGFLSVIDIENLIGTTKNDIFTGSDDANRLVGGLGADNLSALGGNDSLVGGKGNDRLAGGDGLDTFIFAAGGDGSDRITDFTLGDDHISIAGTHSLADITFTRVGTDVRLTVGTLQVLVEHLTVADLHNAANFIF